MLGIEIPFYRDLRTQCSQLALATLQELFVGIRRQFPTRVLAARLQNGPAGESILLW